MPDNPTTDRRQQATAQRREGAGAARRGRDQGRGRAPSEDDPGRLHEAASGCPEAQNPRSGATVRAYYNENNPYSAQWLRNLIDQGHIAPGDVDERSILDVQPDDLKGYRQCHFFAGLGGWSYALRLAGWRDDRAVWTASCPCQPFSGAGSQQGVCDERHLWPAFYRLIPKHMPASIFGEQVASKDGRLWLSGIRTDLEDIGYAVGAADLCAAGVSAPHIRQRIYWVGISDGARPLQGDQAAASPGHRSSVDTAGGTYPAGLVNADGYHEHWWSGPVQVGWNGVEAEIERGGGRYRAQWRLKPGISIVAHGVSGRVGKLCAFGNAIVPQLAAEFIASAMEATNDAR